MTTSARPRAPQHGSAAGIARMVLAALLAASTAGAAPPASTGPAEIEEAADVARRAAADLLHSPAPRLFGEALDTDSILLRRLGPDAWEALTARQRDLLRAGIRERFVRSLAGPRAAAADVAWTGAQPSGFGVDVFLGLRFDGKVLKTRWAMRRVGSGWRIADVVLSDPGVSLAHAAETSLGPRPVERRTRGGEIWSIAVPRLGAIAVLMLLAVAIGWRLRKEKRPLLYLTAAAPIALVAVDGGLAVHRAISEPYVLARFAAERWRAFEQSALNAEREGRPELAREAWAQALAAGGPAGPIAYEIGIGAKQRGDAALARSQFERANAVPQPAPGAGRELALMDVEAGRYAEAEPRLTRYVDVSGPDPESLTLLSVVQTNLGRSADAVASLGKARLLMGEGWRGDEVEARVRARAGDGAGCVAALRALESRGTAVDRSILRADPSYLPIATDPVWVAFLNERKSKASP